MHERSAKVVSVFQRIRKKTRLTGSPAGRVFFAFWCRHHYTHGMDRPKAYAEHRFIGDKRTQLVYDMDSDYPEDVIAELVESEQVGTFGPDTLPEARNRGYRLAKA